ncbi:uncharacterized protein VTP21DRAFT_7758 [Calcarisporiella thermophila]|uniref:uncharacterized protein n=1 Tax=Calcarisporiella thermophila TaxID=911321 RepID=UPI00374487D6
MKLLGLASVFLTITLALSAPHKRQTESPEYVLQLINTIREAHGVKTLVWNTELEKAALTKAERCLEKIPNPNGVLSLFARGTGSWKEAITKLYSIGLSQYDYDNPKLHITNSIFMIFMGPKHKSVGCAAANCNSTSIRQCLFDSEGAYQNLEEFINDIKANVHPANATLAIDSVAPKSMLANFVSPQSYSADISF